MTHDEAIRKLNAMKDGDDPEHQHVRAEEIILRYLRDHDARGIAEAFEAATERVGFWYA